MSPFEQEIEWLKYELEHEQDTVRCMKRVMLSLPGTKGAELAELVLIDAKRVIKDLDAKLEEYRRKHFEWLREVS